MPVDLLTHHAPHLAPSSLPRVVVEGLYVHVPFCFHKCHYCDFYSITRQTDDRMERFVDQILVEAEQWAENATGPTVRPRTIFFGGGTPTLLKPADLGAIVASAAAEFGLVDDVEITTEANPDSVAAWDLEELRTAGFNRISFGMQSAVDHVLRTLDRTHDPMRVPAVVDWARQAGFEDVSLDLIYGTPGESLADWETSVDAALACEPDHVSAYSLIVEEGTALARRVSRGELPMPDEDDLADKYHAADERFAAAGLSWYEVSNWATSPDHWCRHNLLYWTGGHWWGVGPGAHSHVGGVRWWNVKHPAAYAGRLREGASPAHAREVLDEETRRVERVLLETRLSDGLPLDVLDDAGRAAVPDLVSRGLVQEGDPLVLTREGRLLADAVVRDLLS